jgi:hypothetical protein
MKGGCVVLFVCAQLLLCAHAVKAMQAAIERVKPVTAGGITEIKSDKRPVRSSFLAHIPLTHDLIGPRTMVAPY